MAKRNWDIDVKDYETWEDFQVAVEQELASFRHIGDRIGLALIAAPKRERLNGRFVTTGWGFRTETVPALQAPEPKVVPLPVEGPEDEEPAVPAAEGASF